MIYPAFITVLISVRILPVGFDSSDGSRAGSSAEGAVLFGAAPWQWHPRAAVPGQLLGPGWHRDSAVPNALRLGVSPESHSQTLSEDYRLGPGWAFWSCFGMHWGLCRHPEELRAVVG